MAAPVRRHAFKAGNDLIMPGSRDDVEEIIGIQVDAGRGDGKVPGQSGRTAYLCRTGAQDDSRKVMFAQGGHYD